MWTWTMRVDLGLLLLLLALCGSGAQGEDGGLGEEWSKQTTEQTTPDIWAEVRALRDLVVRLDLLVEMLQKENTDLQTRLSSSERELVVRKSRIDQLERGNAEKPKVAFYVAVTDAGDVGPYDTDIILRYSKVFTNIGYAYNPSTGFFTAPVKGVYYFQFTVCGGKASYVGVQVFKNNQQIMYNDEWDANGRYRYITNSVVLELTAGDEIHVVLPSRQSLYDNGDNRSTFSGALLFPL